MFHRLLELADPADAIVRTAEAALAVRSRQQLFIWTRLHLHRFVPHDWLLCRLARPGGAGVLLLNSVPLADPLAQALRCADADWWALLHTAWVKAGREPVWLPLATLGDNNPVAEGLAQAGHSRLLVHGADASAGLQPTVLLVFGQGAVAPVAHDTAGLALWLPHLHAMLARSLPDLGDPPLQAGRSSPALTARELQVLTAVRAAQGNREIGEQLGISALTVKNHLRKIMRKLGASNRVQAVAEAMARQLIV